MNSEQVLQTVEQLLQKKLSEIEQRILILSWEGQSYKDIEESTGYVIGYLRDIGSKIWKELSDVLHQRVTKKNLSLILEQFEQNQDLVLPQKSLIQPNEQDLENNNLTFPSIPLASNSRFYIKRPPYEELACTEIMQQGCLLKIKAPQKMGKTSLLNQVISYATSLDYQITYLDFKDAEEIVFNSVDLLLKWFCANICQQLNLHPNLDYFWDEDIGSKMSCKNFFSSYILKYTKQPIVIAINEIDRIFEYPKIAKDFLPLLRSFHEQSSRSVVWQKLRLVLVYSTDIYLPFKINQSPFNVGLSLKLPAFNQNQILVLAQRYGLNWQEDREVKQLMSLIGGHPYLVSITLYYLSQKTWNLSELLRDAPTPTSIYSQHLQNYLILLQKDTKIMSAMNKIVNTNNPIKLDTLIAYKLESMGLILLNGFFAIPSCELYRLYFREVLGRE